MRLSGSAIFVWTLLAISLLVSGCGRKDANQKIEAEGHEESPSGASFKTGKGISFTDETSKILGIEIADVMEEKLSQVIQLNVQIFSETHRFVNIDEYHSGCDIHGLGFLSPEKAALVQPKQPVQLITSANEILDGFVVAVQKTMAHGENDVIVGITSTNANLKDGEFVKAVIDLPREEAVTVIPRSALLQTAQGKFVYVVNGEAYYRTAVEAGNGTDDKIEITSGLYAGDKVVTKPVETLWLIELRATKGGGHSH